MTSTGSGKAPHRADQLRAVGDADEFPCDRRDDFLAGQRSAAALDHVQSGVDFIGAIDVERQVVDVVEVEHLEAVVLEALAGGFGTGDGALVSAAECRERVDEAVGRRAGTDADHGAFLGVRSHIVGRRLGDGLFEFVLGHEMPRWFYRRHFTRQKSLTIQFA